MKKFLVLVFLFVLAVPVGESYSQSGGERPEPSGQRIDPLDLMLAAGGERPSINPSAGSGQTFYYTHPEFTGVMTRTVTTPAQNTADGYIFVGALGGIYDGPSAIMILDNEAEPVYIETRFNDYFMGDFKVQTVGGTDYLTYSADRLPDGTPYGYSLVLDENYQVVETWTRNNGLADIHEFLLLDNGHAILMTYDLVPWDLSPYGGPVEGALIDVVLEEQDENHNVVFEWRATDHLPIEDSEIQLTPDDAIFDFLHTNAIEVDDDGNWLVSHRHFSEVTKINRQTGAVMWRLGGAGNDFTFTNDDGFSYQHDIRRLDNGNITIFDNGNNHTPPHSRAVEYALDEVAKTVTRVWEYPGDTSEYAFAMGNNQRLPNGNAMIGWGTGGKYTEVQNNGTVALEVLLGSWSYRAFRFPWSGTPLDAPRTIIEYVGSPTQLTLYTSWNGATDVTDYQVYAGQTANTMTLYTTVPRDGFETKIDLTSLPSDTCFFRTRPVDAQADPTLYSNTVFRVDLPACTAQLDQSFMPLAAKK